MEKDTPAKASQGFPAPSRNGATLTPSQAPTSKGSSTDAAAPKLTTSNLNVVTHSADNPTPTNPKLPKASTNIQWSEPIGLHIRDAQDEPLMIFRRAVGINSDLAPVAKNPSGLVEQGKRAPIGVYKRVIDHKRSKKTQHFVATWLLNVLHVTQIVIGATLTALGPNAARYTVSITALGALNTVIAGVLALLKGQGIPNKLHRDEMEFRRLQDWIEETEALLVTGVIGRDNRDIGVLVESAFRKYDSAQLSAENNRPENYVPDPGSTSHHKKGSSSDSDDDKGEKAVVQ